MDFVNDTIFFFLILFAPVKKQQQRNRECISSEF